MSETWPLVYVVILNWNRPEDTNVCLASVAQVVYPTLKILVVDNGSDPRQAEKLCAQELGAEVLWLDRNYGFAEGNNRGIKYALEQGAEFILLLNNDTIVDPHILLELVGVTRNDPAIAIVGPIIYYMDYPNRVWFAGIRFWSSLYVVQRGLHLKPPLSPAEEVDFVSGCGMLIRSSVLEKIGFFSPDYFMYYEDLDFCLRAKRAGLKIVCATQASMRHAVSASTGGADSPLKQYHQVKSSLLFYRRHTRGIMYWVNVTLRFAHAVWVTITAVSSGRLRWETVQYYFKGVNEAVTHDPAS